jgi:DNA-binding beta-propeller fold protein YncE
MGHLAVFSILVLLLTACAAPAKPAVPPQIKGSGEYLRPVLDGTFETSLLATVWKGQEQGTILFPIDPRTGTALPSYQPIALGYSSYQVFSPDHHTLAAVSFPNETTHHGSLILIDLRKWRTQRFDLELIGWVANMAFSPDGNHLAIAHGENSNRVTIFDLQKRIIRAQTKVDPIIAKMKFTASGNALMLYGQMIQNRFTEAEMNAGAPQVLLLDATDLRTRWSAALETVHDGIYPTDESVTSSTLFQPGNAVYLSPGLVFAPDQDLLYVIHPDSEQLTTVDFGAHRVRTIEIQPQLSLFERFLSLTAGTAHAKVADGTSKQAAISPDGQFLYVVGVNNVSSQDQNGNLQMEQTPLGLETVRIIDATRVERLESDATELSRSPDGRYLFLRAWPSSTPWTDVFDTTTRQIVAHKNQAFAQPALLMNGEFVLASTISFSESSNWMSVLEADSLDAISTWTGKEYIFWLPTP